MLIIGSILLLLANAATYRREKSILFNRVAVLILLYSGMLAYDSYGILLAPVIGVFSGLFYQTLVTHSFDIFIYVIGDVISYPLTEWSGLALSLCFKRYLRTSPKAHLKLPVELQEIVIGTILGDLGVERPSPRSNTRLHFKQTDKKKEYIAHLYLLFQEFCGSPPKFMSYFDERPAKMKEYGSVKFNTLSLPCFNVFRELFYNLG